MLALHHRTQRHRPLGGAGFLRGGALLAALTGLLWPVAIAQEADTSVDDADVEVMVVTARRREETLQEVPMAVSAYSGRQLEDRGSQNIAELAQSAPSVTLEASRATNSTVTAFIRGVGQQDPLAGFEPGVGIYIDDVYLARPQGALFDIYDVERIEILRGPQGTLYGRNAVGGALKYVTKKLGVEREVDLKLSLGTYGQFDAVAKGAFPLGDSTRLGFAVASLNRDGYGENFSTGQDNYNKEVLATRASLELLPSSTVFVRLALDMLQDDSNPVAGWRPNPGALSGTPVTSSKYDTHAGAANNESTAGINGNNELSGTGFSALVEWEIAEGFTFKSITAFREDETQSVIDFDSLEGNDFDAPVIYENSQLSQEFQLLYDSDRLQVVGGFYFLDAAASNDFDVVLGNAGATAYTGGSVDTSAWSLFAEATYDLSDSLSLTLGGRYTNDTRTADIFRATYAGIGSPTFTGVTAAPLATTSDYEAERTFTNFSPRVVLGFDITEDIHGYASYSQGFKAGSFDPRGANASSPEVVEGYEPEILDSYEVGVKGRFGRHLLNLAVFFSDYQDLQVPGSLAIDTDNDGIDDDFVGAVTNAGSAEISGLEVEADIFLGEGLNLIANASLMSPSYKEFLVEGQNVAGEKRIQNTPDQQFFLGVAYNFAGLGGTFDLFGSWSFKSDLSQFEDPVPEIDQEAYSLVDLSLVWRDASDRLRVGIHAKNLTDTEYRTSGYNFPSLGSENNITVFHGPPMTLTATVGYSF